MKKTALITGASSGIGLELAKIHAQQGGNLILVARREERLLEIKKELENDFSCEVTIIKKDLTNTNAPKEIYDEIQKKSISIDYLINNAGFGGMGKFHERDWESDHAMIQLNIVALSALTRFFLPDFVARKSGKILNVSSTASLIPGPLQAVYYASKAYVTSLSNALSEELSSTGVTVTTLLPGATATEFGAISGMDKTSIFAKTSSAQVVAKQGYNAMLKGKINILAGETTIQRILLTILPIIPKRMVLKIVRQMQET